MKYTLLGSSGLRVSELCLGAMTFGEEMGIGAPPAECRRVFDGFVEAGGNFIGTQTSTTGASGRMPPIRQASSRLVMLMSSNLSTRRRSNAGGSLRKNLVQSLEAGAAWIPVISTCTECWLGPVHRCRGAARSTTRCAPADLHVGIECAGVDRGGGDTGPERAGHVHSAATPLQPRGAEHRGGFSAAPGAGHGGDGGARASGLLTGKCSGQSRRPRAGCPAPAVSAADGRSMALPRA